MFTRLDDLDEVVREPSGRRLADVAMFSDCEAGDGKDFLMPG